MKILTVPSPKRDAAARKGWSGFFPYYAGFSERFATDLLASIDLSPTARIIDPWNGSGTTTYAASALGYESVGCDINPVMVIIARARLLPFSEADSLLPIADEILRSAKRSRAIGNENDPLLSWFSSSTTRSLRALERSIRRNLVGERVQSNGGVPKLEYLSAIAATMYVSLFSVCRSVLGASKTSNPTWVRKSLIDTEKVSFDFGVISTIFRNSIAGMSSALLENRNLLNNGERGECTLRVGDTATSSVYDGLGEFDFLLTSPPYCTRIDYTASTRVELALLSPWMGIDANALSRNMIGTVKVPALAPNVKDEWGKKCIDFLNAVKNHPSKASSGYYYKNHVDYFDKLYNSMNFAAAKLRNGALATIIIQDSYYKDVHNDLPSILSDMLTNMGLALKGRHDFSSKRAMSGINKNHLTYKDYRNPTEAVLIMEKGARCG